MNIAHKICYKFLVNPKYSYFLKHKGLGHHARCYYDILMACAIFGTKQKEDAKIIKQLFDWGVIAFETPPIRIVRTQADVDAISQSIQIGGFNCFEDVFAQTKKVICDDWVYLIRDESLADPVIAVCWARLQQEYTERYKLVI
jgi:hypothetical protein